MSDAEHAPFAEVFARLEQGVLDGAGVREAFGAIFSGAWTPVQIGAFATALRIRGETAETIGAAAGALREVMSAVDHGLDVVADTCGTGGDGAQTINVSTGAAILVATTGIAVAKHGNRSVSSRCGSADVVAALGIPIDVAPPKQAEILRGAGIAFLMAPAHHPALAHAASARRELGVRTIFNALGPLANPARATHQLVGVYSNGLRPVMAAALGRLGVKRAWVVRSADGLDEISPAAKTRVSVLEDGRVDEREIEPGDFGVEATPLTALTGGDADDNARTIADVLDGDGTHPAARAIAMNAAAMIAIVRGVSLKDAMAEAIDALASGKAKQTLARWKELATRAKR